MISRYTRPAMGALWTDQKKYDTWLKVELAVCRAWAAEGAIPACDLKVIEERAACDPDRVGEIEEVVRHDVIAFLQAVAEEVGEPARHIHRGMTSSDVLDTSLALLCVEALDQVAVGLDALMAAVKRRAFEHRFTVMIGRSHGVHAEPVTFGLKLAVWHDELRRHRVHLDQAREVIAVGKISGAVGTFAHMPPSVEEAACAELGLVPAPAGTQVIQRDRHARLMSFLALLGATLEKIALEIRHLQRTEVLEAEEPFSAGQKGSSAMPHKRNPVICEQVCGLARLMRTNALASLENVALWHERDISHSSVERVIIPDTFILADYLLAKMTGVIDRMPVYADKMKANLGLTRGLICSQAVLLALTEKGAARQEAYELVQGHAMAAWRGEGEFRDFLMADDRIAKYLSGAEIGELFSLDRHTRHIDRIFDRVFGPGEHPQPN
jgi:adenylosuccinate lyase